MHAMTKSTFKICVNPLTKLEYVVKAEDEMTKNHKGNEDDIQSGFMPATPGGGKMCPVATFKWYLSLLNPDCDKLWQNPAREMYPDNPQDPKQRAFIHPMGHNTLDNFVANLSKLVGKRSSNFTNHSLRATVITELKKADYRYL